MIPKEIHFDLKTALANLNPGIVKHVYFRSYLLLLHINYINLFSFFLTGNVLAKQTTCLVYNRAKNDYPGCSIRDTSKCEVKVCSEREEMCHAMYYQSINGTLEPQLLNCHFPGAEPEHCHENVCTLQLVKAHGFYSCCCYGDKCNGNLVWNPPTTNNATMGM